MKATTAVLIFAGAVSLLMDWANTLLTIIAIGVTILSEWHPFDHYGREMRTVAGVLLILDIVLWKFFGIELPVLKV